MGSTHAMLAIWLLQFSGSKIACTRAESAPLGLQGNGGDATVYESVAQLMQAVERIEALEAQLAAADERMTAMEGEAEQDELEIQRLSDEAKQAAELGRQMQQALEAAESRIVAKEEEIASLHAALVAAERAVEREKERSRSKSAITPSDSSQELRADVEALEEELAKYEKSRGIKKKDVKGKKARGNQSDILLETCTSRLTPCGT